MHVRMWEKLLDWAVQIGFWTWLVLLYALHTLSLLPLALFLDLNLEDFVLPGSILLLGTVVTALLQRVVAWNSRGRWERWLPALIYAAFIFSLSRKSFDGVTLSFDTNLFHPLEYMILGIFLCAVWPPDHLAGDGAVPSFAKVLASGLAFGLSDEIHQAFVPGRIASHVDLLLDMLGVVLGWSAWFALTVLRERLKRLTGTRPALPGPRGERPLQRPHRPSRSRILP